MENTNSQEVINTKDVVLEKIRAKYPDIPADDEAALMQKVFDEFVELEDKVAKYEVANDKFNGMLSENPNAAQFLTAWSEGKDPIVEFVRAYGDDFKAALDDPAKLDELAKITAENASKIADQKGLEEKAKENLNITLENMDAVEKEGKYDESLMDNVYAKVMEIANDAVIGLISKDTILLVMSALTKDKDIAQAVEEASLAAKNAKIEALKLKGKGDLPPALSSGDGGRGSGISIPGVLGQTGKKNPWDSANVKRTRKSK